MSEAQFDFDQAFQRKVAALIIRDTTFSNQVKDLVKPEYFTETAVGAVVRMVQEHVKVYRSVPDQSILPTLIKDAFDKKMIRPDLREEVVNLVKFALKADLSNPKFVSEKVADFAKHQAVEQAMIAAMPLMEKNDWAKIRKIMDDAMKVGIVDDGGDYDYWTEIDSRTARREDIKAGRLTKNGITTGYSGLDCYLFHNGWGRRELSCLMGGAKAGKSLGLGDFTKNASLAGYNTLYASLEVASWIIAERIDAALSDTLIKELHKDPDEVKRRIDAANAAAGAFRFKDFASGTMKPSMLNRAIEKYRSEGLILDLVTVDYADIMAAEYRSDNLQENLRTIYIDLRAIAFEHNVAMLTATQTNRDGAKASTAKATDVGDDWNKARTVDILIGINATDEEKKDNEARLYWALSRNTEDGFSIKIKQDRQKMQFLTKVLARV